ncbi:LOB domain-containing protein [Heracleum sosnowskyi]|uniref:LOB domain-containing protein n=1 Tax=Heracleum sosnowskyi TaxID=360622 RepID=A0AAD8IQ44_9APIA|nr:LOB domain-containing protein [Heracleum sosnowskyi]
MQRDNGSPAACAACRHQRKKCTENCVLAPYFTIEKNKEFQAVHKLFGVSNVAKIVKSLDLEDRQRAVDSLVWEATCRQNDPILGSYAEFKRVSEELDKYKAHYWNNYHAPGNMSMNMNMNRNISVALVPANSYPVYGYPNQTLQSAGQLRDEISYNYPYVQNTEGLKEESNNSTVILPQKYGVQNAENLKDERNDGSVVLQRRYSTSGTNQPYDNQLPASHDSVPSERQFIIRLLDGQYSPSTQAKPAISLCNLKGNSLSGF